MHEHVARSMYFLSVHLLYASFVASAAWVLTSIRPASAATKYWIWVVTAFNFVVPVGAGIDKLWAPHLPWAAPLAAIGAPIWNITGGRTAGVLAAIWITGAFATFTRLVFRIRRERREASTSGRLNDDGKSGFLADGIPVNFADQDPSPAVRDSSTRISCSLRVSISYSVKKNSTPSCFTNWYTQEGAII